MVGTMMGRKVVMGDIRTDSEKMECARRDLGSLSIDLQMQFLEELGNRIAYKTDTSFDMTFFTPSDREDLFRV